MKKAFNIKTVTWYALLGLIVAVAILPVLKGIAPHYFPTISGFADLNCQGVTCPEGNFCGMNDGGNIGCLPIASRYPDKVPDGTTV